MASLRAMALLIQVKLKLMGGKWMYSMSPHLTVFQVISPHANQLILCIKALHFSCTYCMSEITRACSKRTLNTSAVAQTGYQHSLFVFRAGRIMQICLK